MNEIEAGGGPERLATAAKEIVARLEPRQLWGPILGLALGLVLLALVVRGVDLQAVGQAIERADLLWVAVGVLTVVLTIAAKAGRWRQLFGDSLRPRYRSLARAVLVGKLVNAVLPAQLGEVARFFVLSWDEGASKVTVMGTIGAEKVFDLLLLVLVAGLTAVVASVPAELTGSLAAAAGLGSALFIAAVALPHQWVRTAAEGLGTRLGGSVAARLTGVVERGLAGLESLRQPRLAAAACAWSASIWGLGVVTNVALFRAFELPLGVGAALLVLTLINAGSIPPSSPAGLGVFHALTIFGLQSVSAGQSGGIDPAVKLAYATLLHAVVYGPRIVLGALALGLRPPRKE